LRHLFKGYAKHKFITMKYLWNIIEAKPHFGFALSGVGAAAGLMTFLKMLTPVIGFSTAVLGLIAAIITVRIKLREWKQLKKGK